MVTQERSFQVIDFIAGMHAVENAKFKAVFFHDKEIRA
jgi:hypothetical protein